MNINRNTWHFRRFDWYFQNLMQHKRFDKYGTVETDYGSFTDISQGRVSLCQYFWTVVLKVPLLRFGNWIERHAELIFGLFIASIVIGMSGLVVVAAGWLPLLLTAGAFLLVVGVLIGALYLAELKHRGAFENALPVQYLKAKKQRVCPIIEFTEE